jgi:hypothetical protein
VRFHLNLNAAEEPSLILPRVRKARRSGKVVVDVLFNSQCPWSGWMVDKIKRNMKKYGATVNTINADDRKIIEECGMSRGVCVNGVPVVRRMASWKEVETFIRSDEPVDRRDGHKRERLR